MTLLQVKNIKKVYTGRFGLQKVQALSNITFDVEKGEFLAIMGESGSGKTTLLNLLGMLDQPTEGQIYLEGKNIAQLNNEEIARFRREYLGFVFQDFNLLDSFSVKDNIILPLILAGEDKATAFSKLNSVAKELTIEKILDQYPYEISGGQKQRTAVARAFITNPRLLLADEPTGSLDSTASEEMLHSFTRLNQLGQTILMVTHSTKAASFASRILFIKDGILFHQIYKGDKSQLQMYQDITNTLSLLAKG